MAGDIQGLSIGLDLDTIELERGLTGLRDRFKTVNSELNKNLSAFDRGEKSVDRYTTLIEGLNEKIKVQEKIVESTRAEMEKMTKEHGAGSKEAERAERAYNNSVKTLNNLEGAVERTTKELNDFQKEQERNESSLKKFSDQAKETGDTLTGVGGKMKDIGGTLTASITAPLLAGGGLLLTQATSIESSQTRIQNALGLTAEEAKNMSDVVRTVYKDGWGESLEHVEGAMKAVVEQLGEIDDPEQLDNAIRKALELEKTFDMDMNEALRGVNALMQTYGVTADEAFDYMVVGAQNGLDKTDELGDNLAEYATLFEENGYSVAEMFDVLQAGLDAGAYNLDKVNDLVKEFGIRASDGSIKKAVEELGGSWQDVYTTWEASGESNDVLFRKMAQNLAKIKDPQEKQVALTEIWGSMGEDAGFKVVEAMGDVESSYEDVGMAADQLVERTEESFGVRMQSVVRDFGQAFLPLGEALLDLGEDILPKVEEVVDDLTERIAGMNEETVLSILKWGGLLLAAGPLIGTLGSLTSIFGSVAGGISKVTGFISGAGGIMPALTVLGGKLSGLVGFLTNPWVLGIGIAVGAGALLTNYLKKDAFDATVDFGDQVSDTTAQAVTDFMELNNSAQAELNFLFSSGAEITEEGTESLTNSFSEMASIIRQNMNTQYSEGLTSLSEFFADTAALSEAEEKAILERMGNYNQQRNEELSEHEARYKEIMAKADEEQRALTEEEKNELDRINREMKNNAIEVLSQSEEEQMVIAERLKQNKGQIDAETAAQTVKKSAEARDAVIADAEQKYDEVVANAVYQRDQVGVITEEEADKIIEEAGRQRDRSVQAAKDRHTGVVTEAQNQAKEHVNSVNWETGEILSKWDSFWLNFKTNQDANNKTQLESQKEQDRQTREALSNLHTKLKDGWTSFNNWYTSTSDEQKRKGDERRRQSEEATQRNREKIAGIFRGLKEDIIARGQEIWDWWKKLPGQIGDAFSNGKQAFGNKIAGFMNSGITKVENGVNKIIDGVNWALSKLGMDKIGHWEAPKVPAYAKGTGYHPGGLAMVNDGKGSNFQELFATPDGQIGLFPRERDLIVPLPKGSSVLPANQTKALLKGVGIPRYEGGIGDFFSSITDGAKGLVNKGLEFLGIKTPESTKPIVWGDLAKGAFNTIKDSAISGIKKKFDEIMESVSNAVGGGVQRWAGVATQALQMTGQFSKANLNALLYQMQTESGGNPRAINLWDINAINGVPSKGLMQVIDPTFQAYKMPGFNNIWNPLDNILASIRYAVSRYGSLTRAYRGVGYATGGLVGHGLYELGEEGYPEWIIPTDPSRRTEAMKLLALAGKQIQGNKRPNDLPTPQTSGQSLQEGDTYHIHITANGDLPASTIRRMADQFEEEIKKKQDRKRMARGEGVSFG